MKLGGQNFLLLNDPAAIRDVLVSQSAKFVKFPRIERTKGLFGNGLLTSEEPLHLRQRRLAQPAFYKERLAVYAREISAAAQRATECWRDGEVLDASAEMSRFALDVVSRTLFSTQTAGEAGRIADALDVVVHTLNHLVTPWGNWLLSLPLPAARRYRAALRELDGIVYGMIRARRAGPGEDDLLGMLMEARDAESGEAMSDEQLRDEAMTIFVAGHETSANALCWALYLLSRHPEARERLEAEADTVLGGGLGGRPPEYADLPRLAYAAKIFEESLRLYPPVWLLGRQATEDYTFDGLELKRGGIVLVVMAVLHRRPELWPEPDRFWPERPASIDKYAYLPFGAGSRLCIGERFAALEATLCLATIAQRWRLELVPGQRIEPEGLLTLRPKYGLKMRAHLR